MIIEDRHCRAMVGIQLVVGDCDKSEGSVMSTRQAERDTQTELCPLSAVKNKSEPDQTSRSSTRQTDSKKLEWKLDRAGLGLQVLLVFLMFLCFIYSSYLSKLTRLYQESYDKVSFLTGQTIQLNVNLTEVMKEREHLQSLIRQTCPPGYINFNSACFLVSDRKASWWKAREDCRSRGADLVIIDSMEEQKFLSAFITDGTWIGLTDVEREGTFKWINDSPLTLTNWGPDQPDNGPGVSTFCVSMSKSGHGMWRVDPCTKPVMWICEKKIMTE